MKPTPRTLALGVGALGALGLAFATEPDAGTEVLAPVPPTLASTPATCSERVAPARRADACELGAATRIARYPFVPNDGVVALALLDEALACRMHAGEEEQATRLRDRLQAWRMRIERDYRDRRLRLTHALATGRPDAVRMEAAALLSLLGQGTGAYTTWLHSLSAVEAREETP